MRTPSRPAGLSQSRIAIIALVAMLTPSAARAATPGRVRTASTNAVASAAPAVAASVEAGGYHNCGITGSGTVTCWGSNDSGQASPPAGTYTAVSSGEAHSCAIATDQTITCWGANWNGQTAAPAGTFTALAAGGAHTCALRSDQTVACWGNDAFGQSSPPAGTFSAVTAGQYHACGLATDGSVTCWGSDDYGQIAAPAGTFTSVTAGGTNTCALRADASLLCWGNDIFGQSTPPVETFSAVSAGNGHVCGITMAGSALCWGANGSGQTTAPADTFDSITAGWAHTCGLRSDGNVACWGRGLESQTAPPAAGFSAVAAGTNHSCGLRADQSLACWGVNEDGQTNAPAGTFTAVTAGTAYSCAIRTDGGVTCWGNNEAGRATPPAGTFVAIRAGSYHGCGIRTNGSLACWGKNDAGQSSPPAGTFTAVDVGYAHSCALRSDQSITCWGDDGDGQSDPPAGTFTAIGIGSSHGCAVATDQTVACWGYGGDGQASPPGGSFTGLAAGSSHTCGIRTDGGVLCWGSNVDRQGNAPAGTFASVTARDIQTCGLRTDGVFNCWGRSAALGDPIIGTPAPAPQTTVLPSRIASTGPVTIWVNGDGLDAASTVSLVPAAGGAAVAATSVAGRAGTLEVRFDLGGIATGTWRVRVAPPGATAFDAGTVTVEAPTKSDLRVSLLTRDRIRPGVPAPVTVTVTNLGNVDARVVPVYIAGLPAGTAVEAQFDEIDVTSTSPVPGLDLQGDPADVGLTIDNGDGTVLVPLVLSSVPAGQSVDVTVRITVPLGAVPFEVSAWATQPLADVTAAAVAARVAAAAPWVSPSADGSIPWGDPSACVLSILAAAVDIGLNVVPGYSCAKAGFQTITVIQAATQALLQTFNVIGQANTGMAAWGSQIAWAVAGVTVNCALELLPPSELVKFVKALWDCGNLLATGAEGLSGCLATSPPTATQTVTPVTSYDPNEKIGPSGVGAAGYTTPDVPFGYAIYFENLATATAAAQVVTVTDTIDTAKFDPATIRLGPVIVGGKVVATPPPGTRDWSTVVPLAGTTWLLDIEVAWDDATGRLVWTLSTLDPVTLEPTTDPDAGFLPPNTSPPAGEGNVTFFVEPRQRTDGMVLANAASIVFDLNAPIVTNTWTNTLDGTPPTSALLPLPATTTNPAIQVSWSGNDVLSGIGTYQIQVRTDGGPAEVWTTVPAAVTTRTFTGKPGHTYAFWSIATDGAGNVEAAPSVADATVTIPALPLAITTTSLPNGTVGAPYLQTVAVTGGKPPYVLKRSGRLPAGVSFDVQTGALSGTPTAPGLFKLAFQVLDSSTPKKQRVRQKLVLQVAPDAIVVTPETLPPATRNSPYKAVLSASGGTRRYAWSVASGALPAGLTLSSGGSIAGTATAPGSATFTVRATDKYGYFGERTYLLVTD